MRETVYPRLSVDEAQRIVLDAVAPLPAERVTLLQALGRTLAEDVSSGDDIPLLANTAMDGYALRSADVAGASASSPVRLEVIHNLAAGYTSDVPVRPGTAIRIMTGAPVPPGADTIIPFEQTEEGDGWVTVSAPQEPGANIRPAGEDVRRGELVLSAGVRLRPQEIGMVAARGHPEVLVHRRPRVGILATGDEVLEIDQPLRPGKIRNANSYSNAAQVLSLGAEPVLLGVARDDVNAVRERLHGGQGGVDLLLTSGGVSVGDFDVVKEVLRAEAEMTFWQVRMRPGKPLAFGSVGGVPLLGLPGNPVSAMVSFEMFARPAILRLLGRTPEAALRRQVVRARLAEDVSLRPGLRYFLRVWLEGGPDGTRAHLTGEQGSGILRSMVLADGLAIIPEDEGSRAAGEEVDVILFDAPTSLQEGN